MKKEPFYFDKSQHQTVIDKLDYGKTELQKTIDAYNKITSLPPVDETNFVSVVFDPVLFISKHLIKKHSVSFNGLDIKPNKLFELIEKPIGFDEMLKIKDEVLIALSEYNSVNGNQRWLTPIELSDFTVVNGLDVVIKKDALTTAKEMFSYYLQSEKQEQVYDKLLQIEKNMNGLRELFDSRLDIVDLLSKAFGVDVKNNISHASQDLKIKPNFILDLK